MKAIKMQLQKSSRPLVVLLASVVVIITSMVVANATQTITTPNAAFISYSLAPGANSAAITPASNRSVLVMGCCTSVGGVGQVSLFSSSAGITWVGLETTNPAAITQGYASSTAGTHIVYIEHNHTVEIQVASANTIRVHSFAGGTIAGNVTLIW
jgi:hypothetical protein